VIDEIQAGMGRTGKWFCHEHYGVTADVVTIAKGIASGLPLAAIVSRKEIWDKVTPGSMGGTFGGNIVACAAANATIEVMKDEDLLGNAARQGDKLISFFKKLQQTYPAIGDVRGKGLMAAIEIVKPHLSKVASEDKGAVVIGTVKGDIHEIGKNVVKLMLEVAGFTVHDLGIDVPLQAFIDKQRETGAEIVAASALLSSTMPLLKDLVELVRAENLPAAVIVGGAPVTEPGTCGWFPPPILKRCSPSAGRCSNPLTGLWPRDWPREPWVVH